jgi:phospholipid/cholesterol/gamma-HCH transport system substrate-binding protein
VNNLAPFVRVFTNTLGNGRWFDSFVNDLIPTIIGGAICGPTQSAPVVGCAPAPGEGTS